MRKGCLIAAAIVIIISAIGLLYYFSSQNNKGSKNHELITASYQDIIKKAVATGSIKPRQEVNIKPQLSGVIDKLFVEAGEQVTKGQNLARIKLIPSQLNINSAQSNVELARIRHQEAKRELARQEELFSKNLDVNQAKVNYENSKRQEERQRQLFEDGVISEQDYEQFRLDAEVNRTIYDNASISSRSNLRQFKSSVEMRGQELKSAINNLQLLEEGATKNSKQVANIVTSTLDGMILDLPVEEGSSVIERNNFNEGTTIAIVADMNSLIFEGQVDEADVGKIKEGMPLKLTIGAIDQQKFDASLEFISPKGVDEDGTVKFEVRAAIISRPDSIFLRAGYSANADIILDQKTQVLSIQERDIIYEKDSAFVEKRIGDNSFEKIPIEIGLSDGIFVEVTNGIDTTQKIKVQTDPNN
jgi:HlyD family secretion protein